MKPAIILLTILVVGGAIVWLIDRLFYHNDKTGKDAATGQDSLDGEVTSTGCADEACGLRDICPSEQILAGECRQDPV